MDTGANREPLPPAWAETVRRLRCASCRAPLSMRDDTVICGGPEAHRMEMEDGVLVLARPGGPRLNAEYALRYAALFSYAYETLHDGSDEPLYRTIASLLAEVVSERDPRELFVLDAGCGAGRVTADCARLVPGAAIAGLDASADMLALARRIVNGTETLVATLPSSGFPRLTIAGRGMPGPLFAQADVEDLPVPDASVDLILSINVVDRLTGGPEIALQETRRVLRPGGSLIFADPLNWTRTWLWEKYPDAASVIGLIEATGFAVETWFDHLAHRERLDARGSFHELHALVVKARKL